MSKHKKKKNKQNNKSNNISSNKISHNIDASSKSNQKANFDDMVSFTNYDLDKKFVLDHDKQNDIRNIFELEKEPKKKEKNVWKFVSFILFLIIAILLSLYLINDKSLANENIDKEEPSEEIQNPTDNTNDNKKDDKEESEPEKKEERYLFLGDSLFYKYNISEYFLGYDVIDSGVDGITAKETLEDLDNRVYQYNPTTVFILLGTNDIGKGYTPIETFEYLKEIIEKIQMNKPEITVNVVSLLPINNTTNPKIQSWIYENRSNEKIDEVNEYLEKYCDENKLNYINVHDKLQDENGQFKLQYTTEGLHITEIGYYHITMELLKYFK